jgi:DNA processing protein
MIDAAKANVDAMLDQSRRAGIAIRVYGSRAYPSTLNRLKQPPVVLFSRGQFAFDVKPRVAIIGTRTPTAWGVKTARSGAKQVVACGGIVVSGLAVGVDSAAHQAAIDAGGRTWAVLPHGVLARPATRAQRALADRILDAGGALLSEYAPGVPPQKYFFVERDRIQAGLSDRVLLIESEVDGGAMHTVRFARQASVPVWATVPSRAWRAGKLELLPAVRRGPYRLVKERRAIRVGGPDELELLIATA